MTASPPPQPTPPALTRSSRARATPCSRSSRTSLWTTSLRTTSTMARGLCPRLEASSRRRRKTEPRRGGLSPPCSREEMALVPAASSISHHTRENSPVPWYRMASNPCPCRHLTLSTTTRTPLSQCPQGGVLGQDTRERWVPVCPGPPDPVPLASQRTLTKSKVTWKRWWMAAEAWSPLGQSHSHQLWTSQIRIHQCANGGVWLWTVPAGRPHPRISNVKTWLLLSPTAAPTVKKASQLKAWQLIILSTQTLEHLWNAFSLQHRGVWSYHHWKKDFVCPKCVLEKIFYFIFHFFH